jgi:preprotein translocase subunit SecA
MAKAETLLAHRLQPGGLYDPANMPLLHHVQQALRAHVHYHLDVQYMIKDGQVVIVDEFTGRLMPGRRWSDGLHQAVEAKEGVKIERENQTLATITFQNYFRKYKKLAGMTGTAETEAPEFAKIYNLDVIVIPTNKPLVRIEEPDLVYRTEGEKWNAIVDDIIKTNQTGRPTLVGTVSIEKSERVSNMLKRKGLKHIVLNAKYHAQEAEIVAQAGVKGGVTIATNMAGRGTDILLGGNPEYMSRQQSLNEGVAEKVAKGEEKYVDDDEWVNFFHIDSFYRVKRADWDRIFTHFKRQCDEDHNEVVRVGGLHIIGTERHEARRIDNQLRGRAGRQGDPGSSRFFLSLEDDLMRIFGSDRISGLMQRLGMEEGVPIEHGMVTRAIERAQKQVEAQNFAVRKHLLEYDDVMNKQRESVYTLRREILEGQIHLSEDDIADIRGYVMATAEELFDDRVEQFAGKELDEDEWDVPALQRELSQLFALDESDFGGIDEMGSEELRDTLWQRIVAKYEDKEKIVPRDILTRVERDIMLQIVDQQWKDHLYSLDHLKEGIGLRGYGQRDPLVEYKKESFALFQDMRGRIEEEVVRYLWWLKPVIEREGGEAKVAAPARPQPRKPAALSYNNPQQQQQSVFAPKPAAAAAAAPAGVEDLVEERRPARVGGDDVVKTVKREEPKIGRNDPCWCGSGKKYKKCHGQ